MVRELEAIFEQGVLRPLEPLPFAEHQRVHVTVTELPEAVTEPARMPEMEWLHAHAHEYPGQWVALQGEELISHGPKARIVLAEARRKGIQHPLLHHVPDEPGLPSAGWL